MSGRGPALVASVAGASLVALDGTVLLTAQPRLGSDLSTGIEQVQWTSTGYLIAVAALLIGSGRLGDRYGHRHTLLIGLCGFAAVSGAIAVAPSIGWVIGLRVGQGAFAALLQPATLALLRHVYPPDRLARPVAIRTALIGIASALGPILGGVLVSQFGWRAVFAINVPLALGAAAIAARVPAESPTGRPTPRPNLVGSALLAAALAVGVATVDLTRTHDWAWPVMLAGLGATGVAVAGFVRHERHCRHPIVPGPVARSRPVAASTSMLAAIAAGVFGTLFVATFHFQDRLGLNALDSGLRAVPMTVAMVLASPPAGAALNRVGPRRTALTGVLGTAIGIGLLSMMDVSPGWVVPAGFAAVGAGFAAVMVTATGTTVGDAPPRYAGVVGGLKQTATNIGCTVGIAMAAATMPTTSGPASVALPLLIVAVPAVAAVVPAALLPNARLTAPEPAGAS